MFTKWNKYVLTKCDRKLLICSKDIESRFLHQSRTITLLKITWKTSYLDFSNTNIYIDLYTEFHQITSTYSQDTEPKIFLISIKGHNSVQKI